MLEPTIKRGDSFEQSIRKFSDYRIKISNRFAEAVRGFFKSYLRTEMRLTRATIDVQRLAENYRFIRETASSSKLMAVIKANAYGHGMLELAPMLRSLGTEFLGVAFADEGARLRAEGDNGDIFVMVPSVGDEAETVVVNDLHSAVSTFEFAAKVSEYAVKHKKIARLHLFIDTGMHRDGVMPDNAVEFMQKASALKGIKWVGACTHFASSSLDREFSYRQLALFNQTIYMLNRAGFEFEYLHASNSGGFVNIPEARFNLIRTGFALYGYPPDESVSAKYPVKPLMQIKSTVVTMRRVLTGESVGYDFGFTAVRDINVATIPIGYGDGYFKPLGNKAYVLIGGKLRPVIGTVCMDEIMVDCGNDNVNPGDEVVIMGEQGGETISAYTIAAWAGTIPYEVTTAVAARVPRVYEK